MKNVNSNIMQSLSSVLTVGYAPEHVLSDDELFTMLEDAIPRQAARLEAISYLKK